MQEKEQKREQNDVIIGRNAVMEALKSDRAIDAVWVARGERSGSISKIIAMASEKKITVKEVSPAKLEAMSAGGNHQGVCATAAIKEYSSIEDVLKLAEEKGEAPFIIIADEIADPHNLGAIIRTAEAAGAHGVVVSKRRAAGLTYAVGKASAGAVEYMHVARVANIPQTIDKLKEKNIWVYAADMDGENWCGANLTGGLALVIGGEDGGVGRLVKEKCDGVISLPMLGKVNSLNASVAAGIVIYEAVRQRNNIKAVNPK